VASASKYTLKSRPPWVSSRLALELRRLDGVDHLVNGEAAADQTTLIDFDVHLTGDAGPDIRGATPGSELNCFWITFSAKSSMT